MHEHHLCDEKESNILSRRALISKFSGQQFVQEVLAHFCYSFLYSSSAKISKWFAKMFLILIKTVCSCSKLRRSYFVFENIRKLLLKFIGILDGRTKCKIKLKNRKIDLDPSSRILSKSKLECCECFDFIFSRKKV